MTEVDFDTRKYRRSAFIPDYRETMYPEAPQYTNEIPFAPQSTAASTRHSVWSAEPQNDLYNTRTNGYSTNTSRRNSIAPIFAKKAAAEASEDGNSVWRYSSSPSTADLNKPNGNAPRRTSTAPVFAQKADAAAATDKDSSSRRDSPSPGPVLRSKNGLVYGHSILHNGDAPLLSPTTENDAASFKTARESVPTSRRYSDGAGLMGKSGYSSYAVQQPPLPQPNGADSRPSRRYSDLSALNGGHNSPRNVSPVDSRRSGALGQFSRSGAVSPITTGRSNSPLGNRARNGTTTSTATNGFVSPITIRQNGGFSGAASIRSGSPNNNATVTSPLARNSMAATPQSVPANAQNAPQISLNTQLAQPNSKKSPTPSEAEEEMDEVIALSPAVRAPLQNFRRSRSSLMLSATPDESQQSLDTLVEGEGKRYFGQNVNVEDLVAVNLENAFDRL